MGKLFVIFLAIFIDLINANISIENSAYHNVVIEISENIPTTNCKQILQELEISLTSSSQYLLTALHNRAYFGSFVVIIPSKWYTEGCVSDDNRVLVASGEPSDITITKKHPIYGNHIWTQQSGGCGENGDQIYLSYETLEQQTESLPREFVREWAKYRYGVFDEIGFNNDVVYPLCYSTVNYGRNESKVTGCSDGDLNAQQLCGDAQRAYNVSRIISSTARSSIMYAAEAKNVAMFCDDTTHNRYAPTKHNQMCDRRSTMDIISTHKDFKGIPSFQQNDQFSEISSTVPKFIYKRRQLTRYVLVVDESSDMSVRDSWKFLRTAIRKWVVYDLPKSSTEIGFISTKANESGKTEQIAPLNKDLTDDKVASAIAYSAVGTGCISCAINKSIEMLKDKIRIDGPANSVILVIAPGMDYQTDPQMLSALAREANIKIATINYPGIIRRQPLDELAYLTGGTPFTVFEKKYNGEKSFITTYFELSNILMHIGHLYYEGNRANLPIEIHRKEIIDNTDKPRSVTNSFALDSSMSTPGNFFVYTNNEELIRSITLSSPKGMSYSSRSDSRISLKQIMIRANISETGSWSYKIEREIGNPQPEYVQVLATPLSADYPVLTARAWVKRPLNSGPFVFYVEVKRGQLPVKSALVQMTVTRPDIVCNNTNNCVEKFELFDTGSGDPDVTKGDGIYSKYFSAAYSGPGAYKFEILVSHNGQTAYTMSDDKILDNGGYRCCGSYVPFSKDMPLSPFERYLPPITLFITQEEIDEYKNVQVGKIGNLKSQCSKSNCTLTWTTPDMGTADVKIQYIVKYATSITDIVDGFEAIATEWIHGTPMSYAAGDESTFIINMDLEPNLIGQNLYFAIRVYSQSTVDKLPGPVSNYVFVHVPRVQPTMKPYQNTDYDEEFPNMNNPNEDNYDNNSMLIPTAHFLGFRPEYIVAGAIVAVILFFMFSIYCYCCISRRRHDDQNDPKKNMKTKMLTDSAKQPQINVIIPQSPNHNGYQTQAMSPQQQVHSQQMMTSTPSYPSNPQANGNPIHNYLIDVPDHHTIGLPIYNIADEELQKNQYTIVEHQEKQLIEELKQQQQFQQQQQLIGDMMLIDNVPNGIDYSQHCNLSIISSSNNTTLTRNGRILSPYESWTASQLLHEHERRHSPLEDGSHIYNHQIPGQEQLPPVPPLPYQTVDAHQAMLAGTDNYIYSPQSDHMPPPQYSTIQRTNNGVQGSINSVVGSGSNPSSAASSQNGGDKKRRNVTMV